MNTCVCVELGVHMMHRETHEHVCVCVCVCVRARASPIEHHQKASSSSSSSFARDNNNNVWKKNCKKGIRFLHLDVTKTPQKKNCCC